MIKNIISGLLLSGTLLSFSSCKTRTQGAGSKEQGALVESIVDRVMPQGTPQDIVKAVQKRLDNLNMYTSTGEFANSTNCPSSPKDPCGLVNIFIEFETPGSSSVGHTGIGVSTPNMEGGVQFHQYFDFGPGTDIIDSDLTTEEIEPKKIKVGDPGVFSLPRAGGSLFTGMLGTQWWDNPELFADKTTPSEIGVSDIVKNIGKIAGDYTVMRIPICVSKAHLELIGRYWVKTYLNMPSYRIPGNHCTSMVAQSFETTLGAAKRLESPSTLSWSVDLLDRYVTSPRDIKHWITSPTSYADRILKNGNQFGVDYRHQCGELKGAMPKAVVIQTESLFKREKIAPYVKWQADSRFP